MSQKRFVLCSAAALLAVAVACSKSPQSPASPTTTVDVSGNAAPDGSTLKVTAPTPQSPVNSAIVETVVLVAGTSTAQFPGVSLPPLAYEFEVKNGAGTTICAATVTTSGGTVTAAPACTVTPDTAYTWIVRASLGTAKSSWSAPATFRTPATPAAPAGGFITGNEIFDPFLDGKSVGDASGTRFVKDKGIQFLSHESRVRYQFAAPLQAGEMSVMVTGIDEGSAGDKTKVFVMQEGGGNDITDNDYRMTVEQRGRSYSTPGAVTWRIIMGDADEHKGRIFDGDRRVPTGGLSDERWYFWKFTWGTRATLEVREDGPKGRVLYTSSRGTGSFAYRPTPHFLYLGSPVGRGGPADASLPGAIYKNLWVSAKPRPVFPGE